MRMRLTRIAVAITLVPAALLVPGCGDDDSGGEPAGQPTAPEEVDVPTDADAMKAQCVEELTSVGQSEAEAEKTCTVPDAAEVDKAVDDALESCLAIVDELPDSEQEQARQECMEAGG
jgi:hypothetical protein